MLVSTVQDDHSCIAPPKKLQNGLQSAERLPGLPNVEPYLPILIFASCFPEFMEKRISHLIIMQSKLQAVWHLLLYETKRALTLALLRWSLNDSHHAASCPVVDSDGKGCGDGPPSFPPPPPGRPHMATSLSIIVPTYNEAPNIRPLTERLARLVPASPHHQRNGSAGRNEVRRE